MSAPADFHELLDALAPLGWRKRDLGGVGLWRPMGTAGIRVIAPDGFSGRALIYGGGLPASTGTLADVLEMARKEGEPRG